MLDDYLLKSWILTKHIHQNLSNFKFIEHINEEMLANSETSDFNLNEESDKKYLVPVRALNEVFIGESLSAK